MFDELIVASVEEFNDALLNTFSEDFKGAHFFSKSFEKKMSNLIRKTKCTNRAPVLKYVASITIVIFISLAILLVSTPSVRASVIGWIKEYCAPYIEYIIPQASNTESFDYGITSLPSEYIELKRTNAGDSCIVIYTNNNGSLIQLMYSQDAAAGSFFVVEENHLIQKVKVSNYTADLYIPASDSDNLSIVWYDDIRGVVFYISAQVTPSELIDFAKSVK